MRATRTGGRKIRVSRQPRRRAFRPRMVPWKPQTGGPWTCERCRWRTRIRRAGERPRCPHCSCLLSPRPVGRRYFARPSSIRFLLDMQHRWLRLVKEITGGATVDGLGAVLVLVLLGALVATCASLPAARGPGVELTAAPAQAADSLLLSVLWTQVDTFSRYDVELLRSNTPDEDPETIVDARSSVGDLDASFFQLRPAPGTHFCWIARVRVSGTFDTGRPVPDDIGPAPWGESSTLCIRTPNPPPGPPDVQIDTAAFVGANAELLGIVRARLPLTYPAESWRLYIPCMGDDGVRELLEVGHVVEVCAYAETCTCPPGDSNVHCPCLISDWGPLVAWELVSSGGRLQMEAPAQFVLDWGNPANPLTHFSPYVYGTCREIRRVS